MTDLRKFGPKTDLSTNTGECLGCKQPFKIGDYTTLIALGPGDSSEAQEKCRLGRPYNAVAIEIHWACATGETE